MYRSLFLVSLAAVGVLGSALPEPDARHVPPRLRTKATRKHATKTKFYAIAPGPPSKNYDGAAEFGRFHPGLFAPKSTTIPDGSIFGGDGESSSTADPAATTASVDAASAASSSASADWGCNSPDTPDTELLPDASCGIYFDEDLDDFYGHYDFSDATFAAALEDFAPGLSSYAAADFDADDVPQFVTVGGQTFSTSSRVDGPATSFSLLRARTPQGLPAMRPPEDFDSIEDFIVELAVRREGQNAVAQLQAGRRVQGFTTPQLQSDLLNAQGTAMMQARASLAQEKAKLALALANAAQARADQAKAAAASGDPAKVAQIALDRKTLPVLAGSGPPPSEAKGVEPLAVGNKIAAAAVGAAAAAGDRAGQVRSQAQSAVQNAQQAANPKKEKKKLVRRLETLDDDDDANNSDLGSALIAQLLLMGVDEQQNPDATSSTTNDMAPAFAYSTVADVTGRFFLAADDSGTLGLTTTAPSAVGGFAPNTFAFFDGALGADARGRLPVYFPAAMDALGVSRFRVAALNDTAFDARAAAAVPVKVDGGGYSVLVPVETEGVGYAFVACDVVAPEEDGDGGVRVNKLFVVRDLEAGVRTLLDASTRSEVTGGVVDECFPVALKSPFGSAGL